MSTVTVYTKPSCVQCNATYRRLDAKGIPYTSVDVSEDVDALDYIKGLGYLQAPVVTVEHDEGDTEHWSGYLPARIDDLAARISGQKETA